MMKFVVVLALIVVTVNGGALDFVSNAGEVVNTGIDAVQDTASQFLGIGSRSNSRVDQCSPWLGLTTFYASLGITKIEGITYCSCPVALPRT